MMQKNSHGFTIFLIVVATMIFFSCKHNEVYYQFDEIKNGEWAKTDTLYFYIDSSLVDNGTPYDVTLEITHNAAYTYSNIWFYTQDNLNDTEFASDSKQYELSDLFGRWQGSGFGALYQLSLPYKKSVYFNEKRNFCIKIVHGMRDEPLAGIEKVGIKIEHSR